MKKIFYHGTSEKNAKQIEKEGFKTDIKYNWNVKSKRGFVYLSLAYAPYYAMNTKYNKEKLALIKVEVDTKDLYPEDDFVMSKLFFKTKYTQKDIDKINLKQLKHFWKESLKWVGNVAVKPNKIKILGIRYFSGKNLICKCDPVVDYVNYMMMGDYYKELTAWIFEGNEIMEFKYYDEGKPL